MKSFVSGGENADPTSSGISPSEDPKDSLFRPWWRPIRIAIVASAFAFFWSGGVVLAWTVLLAIALVVRDEPRRIRACQRVTRLSYRLFHGYMQLFGLYRIEPSPSLRLPDTPSVIVANHPTLVDVTALLSQLEGVCCIAKTSLIKNPLIGPLLRFSGYIDGGPGRLLTGATAVEGATQRLAQGFHVLIFPEGTRSPLRGLHPFRRGAFEIAARNRVPIVPLVLRCDPPALGKGRPFWHHPLTTPRLRIDMVPPMDASAWLGRTRALRDRVESEYRQRLSLPESSGEHWTKEAA